MHKKLHINKNRLGLILIVISFIMCTYGLHKCKEERLSRRRREREYEELGRVVQGETEMRRRLEEIIRNRRNIRFASLDDQTTQDNTFNGNPYANSPPQHSVSPPTINNNNTTPVTVQNTARDRKINQGREKLLSALESSMQPK